MIIKCKKNYIYIDQFKLKCCIGKAGIKKNKVEGDKATPAGLYKIGSLFYRSDRIKSLNTKLNKKIIKKEMAWCDDANSKKYNKLFYANKDTRVSHEKLYKNGSSYDLLIPIYYNYFRPKKNKGSAIFIHLTNNFKPTIGCIGLLKKDFLILCKIINKKTKILISN